MIVSPLFTAPGSLVPYENLGAERHIVDAYEQVGDHVCRMTDDHSYQQRCKRYDDYPRPFFLSGAWVKAEPATDLTVLLLEVLNSLLAFAATFLEVLSFLAILLYSFR